MTSLCVAMSWTYLTIPWRHQVTQEVLDRGGDGLAFRSTTWSGGRRSGLGFCVGSNVNFHYIVGTRIHYSIVLLMAASEIIYQLLDNQLSLVIVVDFPEKIWHILYSRFLSYLNIEVLGAGSWNPFSWMTKTKQYYIVPLFTKRTVVLLQDLAKLVVLMTVSLWNLTGISAALLPRCLSTFRAIGKV